MVHSFKIPSMCLPAHILVTHYILKTWPSLKCDYYSEEEEVLFCSYMHSYISGCPVFNEHTHTVDYKWGEQKVIAWDMPSVSIKGMLSYNGLPWSMCVCLQACSNHFQTMTCTIHKAIIMKYK